MFYVSDIAWIAGYLFLYLLQTSVLDQKERDFRCLAMWLSPLIIIPLTVYYICIGDWLYNVIMGGIMVALFWRSIRGFIYWRKKPKQQKHIFHLALLCFLILEHCLWISSYPWVSDTLTNPYFWIDFIVTISIFLLLPAVRKAVET